MDMAGKKPKTDQDRLDYLMTAVDKLTQEMKATRTDLNANVDRLERGWEAQIARLRVSIEANNEQALGELREEMQTTIADSISKKVTEKTDKEIRGVHQSLRNELDTLRTELSDTKAELRRVSEITAGPYSVDRSVVIYGLRQADEDTLEQTIKWLFNDVMEINVNIVNYMRTVPKNEQGCGVVKVELRDVYEKMQVLKNKGKCAQFVELKNVNIRTCDTHESMVNKTNMRFLLSQMGKTKNYVVASNGFIRRKTDNGDNYTSGRGRGNRGGRNGQVTQAGGSTNGSIGANNGSNGSNGPTTAPAHGSTQNGLGTNASVKGGANHVDDPNVQRSPIEIGTAQGRRTPAREMSDNTGSNNVNTERGREEGDEDLILLGPGIQVGHRILTRVNDEIPRVGRGGRGGRGGMNNRGRGRSTPISAQHVGRGTTPGGAMRAAAGSSPTLRGRGRGRATPSSQRHVDDREPVVRRSGRNQVNN